MLPSRFRLDNSLPLHLCDVAGLLAPVALLTLWRPLRAVLFFWAIGLSTQAFFTPVLREGCARTDFWLFWIGHIQIVGSAFYDVFALRYRPKFRDFAIGLAANILYFALVLPVDLALSVNYGYVGNTKPDQPTIIDKLGPWPLRLVWIFLIVHGVMLALWGVFAVIGLRGRGPDRPSVPQSEKPPSAAARIALRAVIALLLGVYVSLMLTFVVPALEQRTLPWSKRLWSPDAVWVVDDNSGHWSASRSTTCEILVLRRILYVGFAKDHEFYNQNHPPAWAKVYEVSDRNWEYVSIAAGWPWRAVHAHQAIYLPGQAPSAPQINLDLLIGRAEPETRAPRDPNQPYADPWVGGRLVVDKDSYEFVVMPYSPIWPALIANTALFVGAFLLLLVAPYVVRLRHRHARGRCIWCAYDMRGLDRCPECGVPVRRMPQQAP